MFVEKQVRYTRLDTAGTLDIPHLTFDFQSYSFVCLLVCAQLFVGAFHCLSLRSTPWKRSLSQSRRVDSIGTSMMYHFES